MTLPCICHLLDVCRLTSVACLMHGNVMVCELSVLSGLPMMLWEIDSRTRNWTQNFLLSIQCLNYNRAKYYVVGGEGGGCFVCFLKPRTIRLCGVGLHCNLFNNCKCPVTILDLFECQWLREYLWFPMYSLKLLFLPQLLSAVRNDLNRRAV